MLIMAKGALRHFLKRVKYAFLVARQCCREYSSWILFLNMQQAVTILFRKKTSFLCKFSYPHHTFHAYYVTEETG